MVLFALRSIGEMHMQVHLLLGLVVAHLQGGVVVNKRGFQFIDSDPVDAALFAVQFDPVQVDYCGENGQLNIALKCNKTKT